MTLLDTSAWLEMFQRGPRHRLFRERLEEADQVVVPVMVVYEVYKKVKRAFGEEIANQTVGQLRQHEVVPLTETLALEAADYSLGHNLAMADAVIYATARARGATLVTADAHFAGLPGVEYVGPAA